MYFFWAQNIKYHLGWDTPDLHIKPSLYVRRRIQVLQIFNRNSIILICLPFIEFLSFFGSRGAG